MAYNSHGKRIRSENLAGQVMTTAWYDWSVTYNGENRPILWENVSTNSPIPNSSTPTLITMSYDRMGRRVTKNNQRFIYDGYLQIANFELSTPNFELQTFIWEPTEPIATRSLVWNFSTFNLSTFQLVTTPTTATRTSPSLSPPPMDPSPPTTNTPHSAKRFSPQVALR